MISLIWAQARNRVIGRQGEMPWHLPTELAFFKSQTMGKTVVAGRKTAESIGRRLPGRNCVVLTRQDKSPVNEWVAMSRDEVAQLALHREVMVIGGAEIYRLFLPIADRLIVSRIDQDYDGDTVFPPFDWSEWELKDSFHPITDDFESYFYERKNRHEKTRTVDLTLADPGAYGLRKAG